jgi:hypothetical protein
MIWFHEEAATPRVVLTVLVLAALNCNVPLVMIVAPV